MMDVRFLWLLDISHGTAVYGWTFVTSTSMSHVTALYAWISSYQLRSLMQRPCTLGIFLYQHIFLSNGCVCLVCACTKLVNILNFQRVCPMRQEPRLPHVGENQYK
ncbi:hypothetical protein DM02DRAFT_327187 [Periconia macrospinosa]|uniref:Uncharacterized protein n=1 Tax=Periconia macrospinosa TaxID=97972 RepID=A0A2V1EA08_9PLEO|nr:hypothetical protein DM02DRAFT_327187 [Periconia macrospinosa]